MTFATDDPILGSTKASGTSVLSFLIVFQRWATSEGINTVIPPAFLEDLQLHVLEPEINLVLEEHFHLALSRKIRIRGSSNLIFEFMTSALPTTTSDESVADGDDPRSATICVRYVRRWSNDLYILNVHSSLVQSKGRTSSFGFLPSPHPRNARELLVRHWIAPRRWLSEGRAIVIRPNERHTSKGAALCDAAKDALADGFTLLLVLGDLIRVDLPGNQDQPPLLFAGMIWREGKPQKSRPQETEQKEKAQNANPSATVATADCRLHEKKDGDEREASHPPNMIASDERPRKRRHYEKKKFPPPPRRRSDDLAFVISHRAGLSGFSGRNDEKAQQEGWFSRGMYVWRLYDIYDYFSGPWK